MDTENSTAAADAAASALNALSIEATAATSVPFASNDEHHEGVACEASEKEIALICEELGYVPSNLVRVRATVTTTDSASASDGKEQREEKEQRRHPAVLQLYPLRNREGAHKKRQRAVVEPFPTIYWLASRELKAKVSVLEDQRYVQILEDRMLASESAVKRMAECHEAYARERWEMLTPHDRELVARRKWDRALRDVGVAGIRNFASVKCLHTHYAHFLATRDNLIGEWVHELLSAAAAGGEDKAETKTSSSTSSDAGE